MNILEVVKYTPSLCERVPISFLHPGRFTPCREITHASSEANLQEEEMAENASFLATIAIMFLVGFYEVATFAVTQLA